MFAPVTVVTSANNPPIAAPSSHLLILGLISKLKFNDLLVFPLPENVKPAVLVVIFAVFLKILFALVNFILNLITLVKPRVLLKKVLKNYQ